MRSEAFERVGSRAEAFESVRERSGAFGSVRKNAFDCVRRSRGVREAFARRSRGVREAFGDRRSKAFESVRNAFECVRKRSKAFESVREASGIRCRENP